MKVKQYFGATMKQFDCRFYIRDVIGWGVEAIVYELVSLGPRRHALAVKAFEGKLSFSDDKRYILSFENTLFDQILEDDVSSMWSKAQGAVCTAEDNLQLEPSAWGYFMKGVALSALERYEEALFYFDLCLRKKPRSAYVWQEKGICRYREGKRKEALNCYEEAMQLYRNDPLLFLEMSLLLKDMRRKADAQEACRIACALDERLKRRFRNFAGCDNIRKYYAVFFEVLAK